MLLNSATMLQRLGQYLHRFEVNRAVFYNILTQGWTLLSGPLTILVIARFLTAETQGFYYTFNSVLALQVFVELGLAIVIVHVASHEWAHLHRKLDGAIGGDSHAISRLSSLLKFALKWYGVAGVMASVGLSIGGYLFFTAHPSPQIVWRQPWFCLCFLAGINLMLSPFFSIIEGCNQVNSIYSYRLCQAVANSFGLILGILLGFGLFALPFAALLRFVCAWIYLGWKHRTFITQLLRCPVSSQVSWQAEVWPFQWRLSLSWLSGYFICNLFNPVMFYFHGAAVAGQMGMTMSLMTTLGAVSYAWLGVRIPLFGMLIAHHDYAGLDRLFRRLMGITMSIVFTGSIAILILVVGLREGRYQLAERMLPILPVSILLLQQNINCAVNAMAMYLRSHKQEPLMFLSLIAAVLTGTSTLCLGAEYGPLGAATGYLTITMFWTLPSCVYVFHRCRRNWHKPDVTLQSNLITVTAV